MSQIIIWRSEFSLASILNRLYCYHNPQFNLTFNFKFTLWILNFCALTTVFYLCYEVHLNTPWRSCRWMYPCNLNAPWSHQCVTLCIEESISRVLLSKCKDTSYRIGFVHLWVCSNCFLVHTSQELGLQPVWQSGQRLTCQRAPRLSFCETLVSSEAVTFVDVCFSSAPRWVMPSSRHCMAQRWRATTRRVHGVSR